MGTGSTRALMVAGVVAFSLLRGGDGDDGDGGPAAPAGSGSTHEGNGAGGDHGGAAWRFDHEAREWRSTGAPPDCPDPLTMVSPVDVKLATGGLWPGQVRGDGYRSHGGFRFDDSDADDVTVLAPMDADLVAASSYLEQGERQYFMIFIHPCGISYRLDHLLTLSPDLEVAVADVPPGGEGDSRTTQIDPPVRFEAGDPLATAVGVPRVPNIFVDFGVYDLRRQNASAQDSAWLAAHEGEEEFSHHGVCIWDLLPPADAEVMRALPGGSEGKASDYCSP